jgi:hypothetical protein
MIFMLWDHVNVLPAKNAEKNISEADSCFGCESNDCRLLCPLPIACSLFPLYSGSNRLSNALFGLTDMNNRNRGTFTLINFRVSPVLCRRINHNGVAAPTAATHGTTTRDRRPISCTSQTIAARTPQRMMCIWYSPPRHYIPHTWAPKRDKSAINFRCENTRYTKHNVKNTRYASVTVDGANNTTGSRNPDMSVANGDVRTPEVGLRMENA